MLTKSERTSIVLRITSLLLLLLVAFYFAVFYVPKSDLELREDAYAHVVRCALYGDSSQARLKFSEINFVVVPQRTLRITTSDAGDVYFLGYFNPADSTVYLSKSRSRTIWILRHEIAHAVGFIGHPDIPFRSCNYLAR